MSDFTVSGAELIQNCRYPYRADVVLPVDNSPPEARDKGTSVHDCGAKYINTAEATELLDPAEHPTWACMKAWILANWKPSWVAEPAYAWDPLADTARRIGVDIHREYEKHGKLPNEVGGTCDVVSVEEDAVYVYEFGTGYSVDHKIQQLRLQCAVAAIAHGKSRAVGQLVKLHDDGAYPFVPVVFDMFDLAAIRGEYAEYFTMVEGSQPNPGEHCQRCNVAAICPAAIAIVDQVIPTESLVRHKWGVVIANPDHAAWLLAHASLVKKAAMAVQDAVKAYVPKDGLPLSDGSLLIEGTRNMPRFDHTKLLAAARAAGVSEEEIEACSYVAKESSGLRVTKPATRSKKRRAA